MALLQEASPDPHEQRARRRLGTQLGGKWSLEGLLGIGGMASVYEARHLNGRRVAIKILHAEFCRMEEARERFLEEAYAANRVQHPGTVKVLDDGLTDEEVPFLIMDLLVGETLEDIWVRNDGVFEVEPFVRRVIQLLEVLSAAHESGIVHRDVKPENVFLTEDAEVKLLDFGIARVSESRRATKTQIGSTMGTPAYMPPEQARGRWEEVDERSDLWAVGACLYSGLTGRMVHNGETNNEVLLASMTRPAAPVRTHAPDVSPQLAEVIDRALSFEVADRFASAKEMIRALEKAGAEDLDGESRQTASSFPPLVAPVHGRPFGNVSVLRPRSEIASSLEANEVSLRTKSTKRVSGWIFAGVTIAVAIGLTFTVLGPRPELRVSPTAASQANDNRRAGAPNIVSHQSDKAAEADVEERARPHSLANGSTQAGGKVNEALSRKIPIDVASLPTISSPLNAPKRVAGSPKSREDLESRSEVRVLDAERRNGARTSEPNLEKESKAEGSSPRRAPKTRVVDPLSRRH